MDELETVDWVGYCAMMCATMIYVPQIRKAYMKGNVKGVSHGLLVIELMTDVLWHVYAQMKDLKPLMFSTVFLFISCLVVLGLKIRGRKRERERKKEISMELAIG